MAAKKVKIIRVGCKKRKCFEGGWKEGPKLPCCNKWTSLNEKYLWVSSMREEQALLGNAILISVTAADIWQIAYTKQKQTTNQQILIAPDSRQVSIEKIQHNIFIRNLHSYVFISSFLSFLNMFHLYTHLKLLIFPPHTTNHVVNVQKLVYSSLVFYVRILTIYRTLRLEINEHPSTYLFWEF